MNLQFLPVLCVVLFLENEDNQLRSHLLHEQSVTLTAKMWPEPTGSPKGWRISADRLPVLAAVFCGAALVVCLLCALFLYRCCIMPRRDKHYCKGVTNVYTME